MTVQVNIHILINYVKKAHLFTSIFAFKKKLIHSSQYLYHISLTQGGSITLLDILKNHQSGNSLSKSTVRVTVRGTA